MSKRVNFASSREIEKKEKGKTFKIISFNINFGFSGQCESSRKIYKAIEEADADIVCLQETHDHFHTEMRKLWRVKYPYYIYHGPEEYLAGGNEIMSKYALKEVIYEYPTDEDGKRLKGCLFRQLAVEVNVRGEKFLILNVHLRPAVGLSDGVWDHIVSYMYSTDVLRLKELRHYWDQMGEGENDWKNDRKIVIGDFNEGKWGRTCSYLSKNGYKDASNNEKTWFWPLKWGLSASGSFDHIYAHPDYFRLLEVDIMLKYKFVSDHIPVVAEYEIVPKDDEDEGEEESEGEDGD